MKRLSWGLVFALLFVLGLGVTQTFPVRAGDAFWNLRIGQVLLERGELPRHDVLTHTAGKRPWVHHEWGAQVLWAAVYQSAGWLGIRALRGVLVALLLGAWLLVARRLLGGSWAWATAAVAIGWIGLEPHISARPRLLGWLLFAWACYFFFSHPARWTWRRFVAFAAYAVAWVNIHSSAILLPFVAGLELGATLLALAWKRRLRADLSRLAPLALCLGMGGLALLAQPAGPALLGYILETPRINRQYSTEWWPLSRADVWQQHPAIVVSVALLALATVALILRRAFFAPVASRGQPDEAAEGVEAASAGTASTFVTIFPTGLTALVFVSLAIYSRRMTALLVLVALFVLRAAWAWPPLAGFVASQRAGLRAAMHLTMVLTLIALSAWALGGGVPLAPPHVDAQRFPVGAASFLDATRLRGKLYNPDGWGGYLAFRLYPRQRVFVDGRWILVGKRVFLDNLNVILRKDADGILDRYGIEIVVHPAAFYYRARPLRRSSWFLAYQDPVAIVLVRRSPGASHATQNLRRICAFYRKYPSLGARARWPGRLRGRAGEQTPTDLPTAAHLCAKKKP